MLFLKIFTSLVLLTNLAWAQEVYFHSFDEDIPLEKVKDKNVTATYGSGKYTSQVDRLPSAQNLDGILKDVGFGDEVLGMDQMDKDIFVLKVHRYPVDYFKTKYPNIDPEKIKKLKSMMEAK